MTVRLEAAVPRLALAPVEAAAALGCGETYFNDHVRPDLRLVRRGRKVLVPIAELERWLEANAEAPITQQIHNRRSDSP